MENSPFDKLSAELRNEIYSLVLASSEELFIEDETSNTSAKQPPLTETCKQIRNESLLMFYALNQFSARIDLRYDDCDVWIYDRGRSAKEQVSQVLRWLHTLDAKEHGAIGRLVIKTVINHLTFNRRWHVWRKHWRALAGELKQQDYGDCRMQVRVFCVHRSAMWPKGEAKVKRAFERLGFACELVD